jgi:peroxiredoxin
VTAMNIRFGSGVCVAMLALIAGCSPKLKDNAPANRQVAASEMPTSFVDAAGKSIDLKDYRGRAVVLVVVRGIPESPGGVICPYCLAQAGSLAAKYEEFKSRGAEVLLVFPGPGDKVAEFTKQVQSQADVGKAMPYPVCVDKDCSACDRLGIRGDLAKPSTFILDSNGEVSYAYVGKSTSDRPSVKALLAELDRMKK